MLLQTHNHNEGKTIHYLTINAGSSSVKFALFVAEDSRQLFSGSISGIGFDTATLHVEGESPEDGTTRQLSAADHFTAARALQEWLTSRIPSNSLAAIGHRVVHGGSDFSESVLITPGVAQKLRELMPFAPLHMPAEVRLIETLQQLFPGVPHVACFDTAFHHTLPSEAYLLPIPRRYAAAGVRRYGFHGISYSFLADELARIAPQEAQGKVIMAHMGNGVSLMAMKNGQSIDTSMGMTPTSGVPMSTRSGDLEPGLLTYLKRSEGMTVEQFSKMTDFESGLLGLSETTSDMEKLLKIEREDPRAAEAVALFCYQVKKYIGAYSAVLGGLNTLVFSGGMGEAAPKIRARICEGLGFLGITLDTERNDDSAAIISTANSKIIVRVIHTNEAAAMIKDIARIAKEA